MRPALALLLLLTACGEPTITLPPGGARPDVILISIDTLRADHVGAYGYERPTTPTLDALAARGARFAEARSPSPWTLPTHTTLLTGRLPLEHGVVDDGARLADGAPTLQSALGAAGWVTGGVVSSLFVSARYGFDRGFAYFEDFGIHDEKQNLKGEVIAEELVTTSLNFVAQHPNQPVFLFLHLYDVHYPYTAPSPYDTMFDRAPQKGDARYKSYAHSLKRPISDAQMAHQIAQYDEELRYVDDQLGRLFAAFAAAGRSPIIAVTADHGEELGERGGWGHAHTLHPEQLHVPWILAGPGVPVTVVNTPVGTHDIATTLAALVGVEFVSSGTNALAPNLPERPMMADSSRFDTNLLGLSLGGLRLDWDLSTDNKRLYVDAAERHEAAASRPDDVARLMSALTAQLGAPVELTEGRLTSPAALIGAEGRLTQPVVGPARLAVVPPDAPLRHDPAGALRLSALPEGGPLRMSGPAAGEVALSDEERRRLEALGYVQ